MIAVTVQKPRAIFSLVLLSAWLASLPTEADAFDSQGLEDVTISFSFDFWGIEDVTFTDGPGCETTAPDYARAAEQGETEAQYVLATFYAEGCGVPQDYVAAVAWYRKAAEQGHLLAQADLGRMYMLGYGVPQDYATAFRWYRKAATGGHVNAQSILGGMYRYGLGVPTDNVQAYAWFATAAAHGDGRYAVLRKNAVAAMMTPAEIRGAEWLSRAYIQVYTVPAREAD